MVAYGITKKDYAVVPELPGCSAFGETEEEALKEIQGAVKLWLEAAKKEERKVPEPQGKELLNVFYEKNYLTM